MFLTAESAMLLPVGGYASVMWTSCGVFVAEHKGRAACDVPDWLSHGPPAAFLA